MATWLEAMAPNRDCLWQEIMIKVPFVSPAKATAHGLALCPASCGLTVSTGKGRGQEPCKGKGFTVFLNGICWDVLLPMFVSMVGNRGSECLTRVLLGYDPMPYEEMVIAPSYTQTRVPHPITKSILLGGVVVINM